ncbi:hypothetical protein ATN00_18950 [Sphingobium baderi]|uniref:Head-tail adaptor protein n=2 Tax=Sphingobium baderi TaxID=1332080 RepID=A0A0S3F312_9SPHN|nr:hypothetical protein ATN00_18950 [Sphingobium baderi]
MDRRITLQRYTETRNAYNEVVMTWADLATVYAEVRQQGGREFLAAAQETASKRVVFFIRWYPGLTTADRIFYDGRLHNIVEVREIGRRDGVELHTVAAA